MRRLRMLLLLYPAIVLDLLGVRIPRRLLR